MLTPRERRTRDQIRNSFGDEELSPELCVRIEGAIVESARSTPRRVRSNRRFGPFAILAVIALVVGLIVIAQVFHSEGTDRVASHSNTQRPVPIPGSCGTQWTTETGTPGLLNTVNWPATLSLSASTTVTVRLTNRSNGLLVGSSRWTIVVTDQADRIVATFADEQLTLKREVQLEPGASETTKAKMGPVQTACDSYAPPKPGTYRISAIATLGAHWATSVPVDISVIP